VSTRTLIIAIVVVVAVAFLLDTLDLHLVAAAMLFPLGGVVGYYAGCRRGDRSLSDNSPVR
jgi:hypothetical protein